MIPTTKWVAFDLRSIESLERAWQAAAAAAAAANAQSKRATTSHKRFVMLRLPAGVAC